ncbi:hypothetical protein K440DRAFT_662248 [Wilcoxina mikolae CBS 423.85]|nr:hypothetical protein K440DRAFT_662248 [Wilcoxina mikolae CBS 423.85]
MLLNLLLPLIIRHRARIAAYLSTLDENDIYCGLCGCPFYIPSKSSSGPAVVSSKCAKWLEDVRLLGYKHGSPHYPEPSEPKHDDAWASHTPPPEFLYSPSDDDSEGRKHTFVSTPGTCSSGEDLICLDGEREFPVYCEQRVGVHDNCWTLLFLALDLGHRPEENIMFWQQDVVVGYLVSLVDEEGDGDCTAVDFGDVVEAAQDQFWEVERDEEEAWVLADFVARDKGLEGFLKGVCEEVGREERKEGGVQVGGGEGRGCVLDCLPPELLDMVMQELPKSGVRNFRLAYRPAAVAVLSNQFWRSRFVVDLPILFEMEWLEKEVGAVPWERVYRKLVLEDNGEAGVAWRNRRRVWGVVSEVAKACWRRVNRARISS